MMGPSHGKDRPCRGWAGGEVLAMVVVDAIAREIPRVLGHAESLEET